MRQRLQLVAVKTMALQLGLVVGLGGLASCTGEDPATEPICLLGTLRQCEPLCPDGQHSRAQCVELVGGDTSWGICSCPATPGEGEGETEGGGDLGEGEGETEGAPLTGEGEGEPEGAIGEGEGAEPLTVASVEPRQGPVAGGTELVITGTGFARPTTVFIGTRQVTSMVIQDPSHMTVRTPPADSAGLVDIQLQNRNGLLVLGEAFSYYDQLRIEAVAPPRASTQGGTALVVTGSGFTAGALVSIGGRLAVGVTVVDASTLLCYAPRGPVGPADLRVFLPDGRIAVLPEALTFHEDVSLTSVTPSYGPTSGSTLITLQGNGFTPATQVTVGVEDAQIQSVAPDGRSLSARTPPQAAGVQSVVVFNEAGAATLPAAFTYFDPEDARLQLLTVTPRRGSTAGGDLVSLLGNGFTDETRVIFDGTAVGCAVGDANTIQCRTPPHAEGMVDVLVRRAEQEARLPGAFTYLPPMAIRGINPRQGGVAGGTPVTVRGSGFRPGALVQIGVLPADAIEVVNDTTIRCATPPGGAGPADVMVRQEGQETALPGGFTYTDALRVLYLDPPTGSIAGGNLVNVIGSGFLPGTTVLLGGVPAVEIEVLEGSLLHMKTPPGSEGVVDVAVTTPDGASTILPAAFEYYDPTTLFGGVWGGPVSGSLNISVRNAAAMDLPVPDAFTILWADRRTQYQGTTDANGMITFSGPDLDGEQMITVAKDKFENTSVVRFNAENVTIALQPKPDPQPGQPPPGVPAATISGVVWGMDKYIPRPESPELVKVTYVTTTIPDFMTPADYWVPPGPGGVLYQDGPYSILARLGDLAVIVVAGYQNELTGAFTPLRMGVRRFVFGVSGQETTDVNIQINLFLDQTAELTFDRPVRAQPGQFGPNALVVRPYINFGSEGVYTFYIPQGDGWLRYQGYDGEIVDSLALPGFPALSGDLDGTHYIIQSGTATHLAGDETDYVPESMNLTRDVASFEQPILITPFVGIPIISSPTPDLGMLLDNHLTWELDGGSSPPNAQYIIIRQPSFPAPIPIWSLFIDGTTRDVVLPDLQDINGFPQGVALEFILIPFYKDGLDFNEFQYTDYNMNLWRAFSAQATYLLY